MNIALIGYGKMGKEIENILMQRGHTITLRINSKNIDELNKKSLTETKTDIAIEFTNPVSAYDNIKLLLEAGVGVVCGTTGWLDRYESIVDLVSETNGSFIYASNFSIGVNLFFALNKYLAQKLNSYPEYIPAITEIHHTQKLDAPSGTAITLAEGIIDNHGSVDQWFLGEHPSGGKINIDSKRLDKTPGTHIISYESKIDAIEIKHTAHSRKGFAQGVCLATEYLENKTGIYTMNDVLGI